MENFPSDSDLKNLVRELSQGRDLAKQLQNQLNLHSSSSHESREFLLQRILFSYDHALSMLTHTGPAGGGDALPPPPRTASVSPRSLAGSPESGDSDQDQASRKRKTVVRWSEKVKVRGEGGGIEGQLDDGYGWRKYGQKDILGAKHPRGYYRCTYRHTYGCLATKQVQRSDEDPTVFEITYRRNHTCTRPNNPPIPTPDPHNTDPSPSTQTPPFNIQTSLRVITPDLDANANPFNFPSSSLSSPLNAQHNHIFSYRDDTLGHYYPDLNDNYGELIPNLGHSDSELGPIVAAMTSITNSATIDADFPFGPSGFGSGFDFGNPGEYP